MGLLVAKTNLLRCKIFEISLIIKYEIVVYLPNQQSKN